MALAFPDTFGWFNFTAGAAMLLLALSIFALAPGARLYQLLALFLVLRGTMNIVEGYDYEVDGVNLLARLHVYLDVAVAASAIAFAIAFRRRYGPSPPKPRHEGVWLLIVALLTAIVLVTYALDKSWYYGDGTTWGPLALAAPVRVLVYSSVALLVARDAMRTTDPARAGASELVALGFALTPLFIALPPSLVETIRAGDGDWTLAVGMTIASAALVLAIAAVVTIHRAARATARPFSSRRALLIAGATAITGVIVLAATFRDPQAAMGSYRATDGLSTLGLPLLVAYAILKHRLFDLDVRLRWTLSHGTTAAVFIAVFFVASEIAAQLFQGWTGSAIVGILAAGLLVFAIAPIQQLAERLARAAVPGATPVREWSHDQRLDFYGQQLRVAWADGSLTKDERRLLDSTRERLGITAEEAARLESDVLSRA